LVTMMREHGNIWSKVTCPERLSVAGPPALDGELELRWLDATTTRMAITAQYRCHELLRELGDTIFLRRVAESVLAAFVNSLQSELQASAPALAGHRS